jgi:hypothetical protein
MILTSPRWTSSGIPAARGDESGGEPDRQVVVVVTFFVTSAPTAAAGAGRAERIEAARKRMEQS